MNYVALYRKYRPSTFNGIIGQEHIVDTLVNQIKTDKVSHAYLFTGTRGTGKTSVAKILAKAINCLQPVDGSPCGKCKCCQALSGNSMDIIEMDAASNNGVDYARDIREKVQYPPTVGRYKVYIIDEVHMLSIGAFNALLKTIEEPPAHAVFILCTTEIHKIPATIVSRCMRFDFALIPTSRLCQLVSDIYDSEGKSYSQDAIYAIAQAGEGSARDCLSIADRCYSLSQGELTYDNVMSVLGTSSRQSITTLSRAILSNDISMILTQVHMLLDSGKDITRLNRDLMQQMRDMLVAKSCDNANSMLRLPEEAYNDIYKLATTTTVDKLLYIIDSLSRLEMDMRYALSPSMLLEAVLLRVSASSGQVDYVGLDKRIARLEGGGVVADTSPIVVDKDNALSIWRMVSSELRKLSLPLLVTVWLDVVCTLDGNNLVVTTDKGGYLLIDRQYRAQLADIVTSVSGKTMTLVEKVDKVISSQDQLKQLDSNIIIK